MVNGALFVRLKAKPGKEADVETAQPPRIEKVDVLAAKLPK